MSSFKIIGLSVLEKNYFKVFTIVGQGGHLGNVIYIYLLSLFPKGFHMKFGFDLPSGYREEVVENNSHVLYIAHLQGQTAPWRHNRYKNINILLIRSFILPFK